MKISSNHVFLALQLNYETRVLNGNKRKENGKMTVNQRNKNQQENTENILQRRFTL